MTRQRDLAEAASFTRRRLVGTCLLGHTEVDVPDAWRPLRRLVGGAVATVVLLAAVAAHRAYIGDAGAGRAHAPVDGTFSSSPPP
jgi:hypothetical protein